VSSVSSVSGDSASSKPAPETSNPLRVMRPSGA
jgi:hypothetical protein